MGDRSFGDLSSTDIDWLNSLGPRAEKLSQIKTQQRQFLLREIRVKLRADYLFWGYGVQDPKSFNAITAEYYDDAEDALTFDESKSAPERLATNYRRYAWVAHTLTSSNPCARIFADILRSTTQRQVTVEQAFLQNCVSFRTKLALLARPHELHLLVRRADAGLDDYMFTLRRIGENASSGIGYHRASIRDPRTKRWLPGEKFSRYDRLLADAFSRKYDDVLHHARVDIAALESICREGKLSYWERVTLPMLLSNRHNEEAIALILDIKPSRVSRLRRDICTKLGAASEQRRSLQDLFHSYGSDRRWDDAIGDPSDALEDLRRSSRAWEPDFLDSFPAPPLHEKGSKRKGRPELERGAD